ncbi:MAG: sulfite exporter TauE/SafE family protein [archaeon]
MLAAEAIGLLAMGLGIGAFGTLVGAGGGFLIVPLLVSIYDFDPALAVGTSLLVVFFNALSGSLAYLRQRRIDVKVGLMFIAFTIPGSIIGAYVTSYFSSSLFKIVFSGLLVVTSLYLIARPCRDQCETGGTYRRTLVDSRGNVYEYSVNLVRGLIISLGVGFISSIFGIGGGIIHVPAMIFLLGFPVHISTATSQFILAFTSLAGAATHSNLGNVNWEFAPLIGVGTAIGAQLGAFISPRTRGTNVERILGLALAVAAARLLMQVF